MENINTTYLIVGFLVLGMLTILFSYSFQKPELLLLSIISFILGILIWRFGYFIGPMISSVFKISTKFGEYELTPEQDIIIKKTDNGYYASMFLSIALKDSSTFKTEGQNLMLMQMFEKAITSLRGTTKISVIITNVDVSEFLEKLIEKRSLAEQKRSQLKQNSAQAAILDREIEAYNIQIKQISTGEKPMQVLAYAQVSAYAPTKNQVMQKVRNQAQQTLAVLANALATEVTILNGRDILSCFEWEIISPVSKTQIENELS